MFIRQPMVAGRSLTQRSNAECDRVEFRVLTFDPLPPGYILPGLPTSAHVRWAWGRSLGIEFTRPNSRLASRGAHIGRPTGGTCHSPAGHGVHRSISMTPAPSSAGGYSAALAVASFSSFSARALLPAAS